MKNPAHMQSHNRTPLVLILTVTAFAGGLLLGNSGLLSNKSLVQGAATQAPFDQDYLKQIYTKVQEDHLGTVPTNDEVTQSMAKGLIESLNDPYSAYLNPKEAQDYLKLSDSAYDGIGIQLGYNDQYTTVQSVMDGYPGQKAGLKAGDLIVSIDGADMAKTRPEIVATKIKGVAGTSVKLSIFRESEGKLLEFNVVRAEIKRDNITIEQLSDGVVKINIGKFTQGAHDGLTGVQVFNKDWDDKAAQVAALNPKKVIVDLRNNPGGFVDGVRHVAEEFLTDGSVIMREQEKGHDETVYHDNRKGQLESVPMVVLVNEGSASASEIFSGAIHDNKRGKIVGVKTVGKGVEQELLPLSDNSILLLVFRKWLTPDGRQINKDNPITPDEIVEYAPPAEGGKYDTQVAKAIELLSK